MIVACVLKSGGDFTPEYVSRLRDGVAAHLGDHRFVCLSDVPVDCERIPLGLGLPGWWSKLELFQLTGKVIYLDLDTVINGPLQDLADIDTPFSMLDDLNGHGINKTSGVMVWNGDFTHVMEDIGKDPFSNYRSPRKWGDQGWISSRVKAESIQAHCRPGFVASHKWGKIEDRQAASVVCYHGQPRPHRTGWAI